MFGDRALVLDALAAEKRQAQDCHEHERAAEIQEQIDRLSAQGSAVNPASETAARPAPGRPSRRRRVTAADRG